MLQRRQVQSTDHIPTKNIEFFTSKHSAFDTKNKTRKYWWHFRNIKNIRASRKWFRSLEPLGFCWRTTKTFLKHNRRCCSRRLAILLNFSGELNSSGAASRVLTSLFSLCKDTCVDDVQAICNIFSYESNEFLLHEENKQSTCYCNWFTYISL